MKTISLAAAALLASVAVASAQTGLPVNPDTQRGPAQEGGRTQATPGYGGGGSPVDTTPGARNTRPSAPDPHSGPATEAGRGQATPGYDGGGSDMDATGSISPRASTPQRPDSHTGGAVEGGRNQATPGPSR